MLIPKPGTLHQACKLHLLINLLTKQATHSHTGVPMASLQQLRLMHTGIWWKQFALTSSVLFNRLQSNQDNGPWDTEEREAQELSGLNLSIVQTCHQLRT